MTHFLKQPDPATITVPVGVIAAMFGISDSAIMKAVREAGMPAPVRKGAYPLVECVRWRLDVIAKKSEGETTDVQEARRKLYDTQREKHNLEMSQMRAELLVAEEVDMAIQRLMSIMATQLDALGPRTAARLAMLSDPAKIAKELLGECRNIRRAAADAVTAFAVDLDRPEDPDPAPRKGRGGVGGRQPRTAARQSGAGAVAD